MRGLMAKADALVCKTEASRQESVHGLIDGVRSVKHQRFDAMGGERIDRPLSNAPANHRVGAGQQIEKAAMIAAGIGGTAAKSTGNDGAVLNLQDQKRGAAGQMAANRDTVGSGYGDSGRSHEVLR